MAPAAAHGPTPLLAHGRTMHAAHVAAAVLPHGGIASVALVRHLAALLLPGRWPAAVLHHLVAALHHLLVALLPVRRLARGAAVGRWTAPLLPHGRTVRLTLHGARMAAHHAAAVVAAGTHHGPHALAHHGATVALTLAGAGLGYGQLGGEEERRGAE